MAMRSVLRRVPLNLTMEGGSRFPRYFSGKVLSEEERAAETIYIQKMEREKKEKLKLKAEKEAADAQKEKSEQKTEEGTHKG